MKNFIIRLNILSLFLAVLTGIYGFLFAYLGTWVAYANNNFLYFQSGTIFIFAALQGLLLPIGYVLISSIVSWLVGAEFKFHKSV